MKRLAHAAVSIGLLLLAMWLLDFGQLAAVVRRFQPASFALTVLAILCLFVLLGVRWYWIVVPVVPLGVTAHIRHFLYATFANTFTPAMIGSDVYRVAVLGGICGARLPVIVAVLRERYIGLVVYIAMYLACFPAAWSGSHWAFPFWTNPFAVAGAASLTALVLLIGLPRWDLAFAVASKVLARWPRVAELTSELRQAARFGSGSEFVRIAGVSIFGTAMWIVVVHSVATRLDIQMSWAVIGAIAVLAELLRLVPATLQGVGLREGAFAYFMGVYGESPEAGFVLGAIVYLALTCAVVLSGPLAWTLSLLDPRATPPGNVADAPPAPPSRTASGTATPSDRQ